MHRIQNYLKTILFISILFISCEDDNIDDSQDSQKNVETYGGVIIGSSGYYTLTIKSGNSVLNLVFNGEEYNITNSETVDFNSKIELTFQENEILFKIAINQNDEASVNITIPNHNIVVTVVKSEGSNLNLYTGSSETYIDNELFYKATYNLSIAGKELKALQKTIVSEATDISSGEVFNITGEVLTNTDTELSFKILTINGAPPEGGSFTQNFTKFGNSLSFDKTDGNTTQSMSFTKVN